MVILLGDYSSVHLELSKALREKGYDVLLFSDGDAYKNIDCDVKLPSLKTHKNKWIRLFLYLVRFFGLFGFINYLAVKREIEKIGKISVAQIINPVVAPSLGGLGNIFLIRYLRSKVDVLSLCALGDDYHWVRACLNKRFKYSPMDRLTERGVRGVVSYLYSLKYVYSPLYRFLDFYARKKSDVIIPGLLDYKIAYGDHEKLTEIIGLPLSKDKFQDPIATMYPIRIFHAWQAGKESRKGNDVLDSIARRYMAEHGSERITYQVVSGVPYKEYIERYKSSDIVFDQVYSYDRGVTGALGMAAGKVVFSGFEEGDGEIGINAIPNEDELYRDFEGLMDSLHRIDEIKRKAYEYALDNYAADTVCDKYIKAWSHIL